MLYNPVDTALTPLRPRLWKRLRAMVLRSTSRNSCIRFLTTLFLNFLFSQCINCIIICNVPLSLLQSSSILLNGCLIVIRKQAPLYFVSRPCSPFTGVLHTESKVPSFERYCSPCFPYLLCKAMLIFLFIIPR